MSGNRVVVFSQFGGPEVLRLEERPIAEPGPGEVRVRMAYAGLNPVDYKIRRGGSQYGTVLPSVLGRELSGVVESTGPEVERLAEGDEVFGTIPVGAFADTVVVPEANMAFVPADMPMDVAGGLALAGQTAWDALASQGIGRGDTIVVSAAAGGVGSILSQLAVHAGARVIGSASHRNHGWLRSRGVEPVEYGPGLVDAVRALITDVPTAAFALFGAESVAQFLELGIPAERINSNAMGAAVPPGVRHVGRGPANLDTLGTLAAMVVDGAVEVPIAAEFPLSRIADAFEVLEGQHLRGKVVVSGGE
ncbi:MAG TPA: NADP-dependent oxidoreductase [Pseudolysinimonas sp.]|nr:NADP-dependent oxidoreductase [Pseudolysinimonas sp.]